MLPDGARPRLNGATFMLFDAVYVPVHAKRHPSWVWGCCDDGRVVVHAGNWVLWATYGNWPFKNKTIWVLFNFGVGAGFVWTGLWSSAFLEMGLFMKLTFSNMQIASHCLLNLLNDFFSFSLCRYDRDEGFFTLYCSKWNWTQMCIVNINLMKI